MTFEEKYHEHYSREYGKEIDILAAWFHDKIEPWQHMEISEEQRKNGVDDIPEILKEITLEAFREWGRSRSYELSYNQTCIAFFAAWDKVQDKAHEDEAGGGDG